jgi:two-component system sensor histidine kinase CpxA
LNVRVLPSLKGRKDDLGLLAADFDAMAERVRSLLESKHQLLRDVSHELRSPLARLQLALSLAQRGDAGTAENLARIGREADRLEQLIARALLLARLERPALGAESERVDIAALLGEIVADVAIEADVRRAQVALSTSGTLEVMGDREALRSAFENVLRNAVRYSPAGSQLAVRAERCAASIEVVIEDQGPGVPEKDLQLIFEPFYRVDASRDRAEGGEGLGLAIAARSHQWVCRAGRSAGACVNKEKAALAGGFRRRSETTGGEHRVSGGRVDLESKRHAGTNLTFVQCDRWCGAKLTALKLL